MVLGLSLQPMVGAGGGGSVLLSFVQPSITLLFNAAHEAPSRRK